MGLSPGPTSIGEEALSGAVRLAPRVWILVENRTVFDRAVRISSRCGVIWVTGYAPAAWLALVGKLLHRMPSSAMVLSDPDPAGVELALRALRPWRERGLAWQVEGMSLTDAVTLPSNQPLSAWDSETLRRVAPEVAGTPLELETGLEFRSRERKKSGLPSTLRNAVIRNFADKRIRSARATDCLDEN